jgi:succinate-semialdehyde dehydrogenase/glutarate-semialdehyde dehydrogenase
MVNDAISAFGIAEAPHGGFEQSGIGRAHGELGLEEMVLTKYVDVDLLPRMKKVWWFGYGKSFEGQMSGFVEMLFGSGLAGRIKGAIGATGALLRKNRL